MDNLFSFLVAALIIGFFLWKYLRKEKKRAELARAAAEKGKLFSEGPRSQHPHIDANYCIGCAACTMVCPEGDVLAMLGGKAVIVNGYKCIGHSLCAEVCPVGAITMVMASPSMGEDMPYLTPEYETTIKNMFIVGELGGLALIKNAVNQGRECIDTIANRMASAGGRPISGAYDVLIVGAGPAGISASLRAIEKKMRYLTLDAGEIGGTVAKYPRQKLVMTSPVEFPMHGKFKKTELSKEELIAFWNKVLQRADFKLRQGEKVEDIKKGEDQIFTVATTKGQDRAQRSAHRGIHPQRQSQSHLQLRSRGVQREIRAPGCQWQTGGNPQRLRLDLRRRRTPHCILEKDRHRFREPRPHIDGEQRSKTGENGKTGCALSDLALPLLSSRR